jgi:lantibiotic modifying enzyme
VAETRRTHRVPHVIPESHSLFAYAPLIHQKAHASSRHGANTLTTAIVGGIASPSWVPILTGGVREEALAAVEGIASALLQPGRLYSPNLAGGEAGTALFFASLALALPDGSDAHLDRALDLLGSTVEALAKGILSPMFYSGFTGIAWAVERLRSHLSDEEDLNADIDAALASYVAQRPWRADYDLVSGLVGHGVYALERKNALLVEMIVDRLTETAEVQPEGTTWYTEGRLLHSSQRPQHPEGYYNLGLAHGVPGVIAFLAQVCAEGVAIEKARPLLDGAIRWLLSKKRSTQDGCRFATVLDRGATGDDGTPSRVSWCYGDLGISVALLWAARSVAEPSWEREALDLARHTARRPLSQNGIMDAALCHGAAGNAHLFNRLYQATREQLFRDAAHAWFAAALALRQPDKGVGGFQAWRNDDGWQDRPGLLEGAAGIGLALLAATSSEPPDWDRMLLVSVPPR